MKLTAITTALLASASLGFGATTFNASNWNGAGADGILITDNAGNPTSAASWAIGTFSGAGNIGNLDGGTALTDFVPLVTTGGFSGVTGVFGNFGAFGIDGDISNASEAADAFVGNEIFVVIGNNAAFGSSTDYIIYSSGQNFNAETDLNVGPAVTVSTLASTLLRGIGTTVQNAHIATSGENGQDGVTFGAVPEPSTSLLFGAAGLALLIRRKR